MSSMSRVCRLCGETVVCTTVFTLTSTYFRTSRERKSDADAVLQRKHILFSDREKRLAVEFQTLSRTVDEIFVKECSSTISRQKNELLNEPLRDVDIQELTMNLLDGDRNILVEVTQVSTGTLPPFGFEPKPLSYVLNMEPTASKRTTVDLAKQQALNPLIQLLSMQVDRNTAHSVLVCLMEEHRRNLFEEMKAIDIEATNPNETLSNFYVQSLVTMVGVGLSCVAFRRFWPMPMLLTSPTTSRVMRLKKMLAEALLALPVLLASHSITTATIEHFLDSNTERSHYSGRWSAEKPSVGGCDSGEWNSILHTAMTSPLVWPGATRDDPLTAQRLAMVALMPVLTELTFRGMLFPSLRSFAHPVVAHAFTTLACALSMGHVHKGSGNNITTNIFNPEDCAKAVALQGLFAATGSIAFPLLAQWALCLSSTWGECSQRNDLQLLDMSMYSAFIKALSLALEDPARTLFSTSSQTQGVRELLRSDPETRENIQRLARHTIANFTSPLAVSPVPVPAPAPAQGASVLRASEFTISFHNSSGPGINLSTDWKGQVVVEKVLRESRVARQYPWIRPGDVLVKVNDVPFTDHHTDDELQKLLCDSNYCELTFQAGEEVYRRIRQRDMEATPQTDALSLQRPPSSASSSASSMMPIPAPPSRSQVPGGPGPGDGVDALDLFDLFVALHHAMCHADTRATDDRDRQLDHALANDMHSSSELPESFLLFLRMVSLNCHDLVTVRNIWSDLNRLRIEKMWHCKRGGARGTEEVVEKMIEQAFAGRSASCLAHTNFDILTECMGKFSHQPSHDDVVELVDGLGIFSAQYVYKEVKRFSCTHGQRFWGSLGGDAPTEGELELLRDKLDRWVEVAARSARVAFALSRGLSVRRMDRIIAADSHADPKVAKLVEEWGAFFATAFRKKLREVVSPGLG